MAVEDIHTQLDAVADKYKLINGGLKGGVQRFRVVKFSVAKVASGVRGVRPASVSRAAGDVAKEVFVAGEPIRAGAALLRSVIDIDATTNPDAQSAYAGAENAEKLMDGGATFDGTTLPEIVMKVNDCAKGVHEHTAAILDRLEAMQGRLGALQQALGEVASGPVTAAAQSVITYRNQL